MQTVTQEFTDSSGANSTLYYPAYGINISWTKQENESYNFFTIGPSAIGGTDFIPGSGSTPAYANQYAYTSYTEYMLSGSVTRNIGQYTYGAFGAQCEVQLDNTSLIFMPGYDPIIGDYIVTGRPINIAMGFNTGSDGNTETINVFYGQTTAPRNDIGTRQITLSGFDLFDYAQSYQSKALGPIAAANNGCYVNLYANQIIGDLLQEIGLASNQYIAEQSTQAPIGFYSPYGLFIGDIIQALCEAEQALFFFDENGIAHFWNRQHIPTNDTPVWTFDENDTFELNPEDTPIINDVQIQATPRAVQPNQQIWVQTSSATIPAPASTTVVTNLCTNPSFSTGTLTGWTTTTGISSAQATLTEAWPNPDGIYSTYSMEVIATSGGSTVYAYTTINCTINTNYVAQCEILAPFGDLITIYAIENGITLASASVTADGHWDLLQLPSFMTDGTHTSFIIGLSPNIAMTYYIDAVMVQLAAGASSTYFDGNDPVTSSYIYRWTGSFGLSTSTATPCSTATVEADFEDDNGSLPVSSVDLPIYYSSTYPEPTSLYEANTQPDDSGIDMESYVSIVGTSLLNQPDDAATLSGSSYFITFANTYPQPVYITQLVLWGTPAKVTYQINYEYQDQASITLYGDNPTNNGQALLIQNDLIQNPSTAESNAIVLVNDYNTAYKRVTADVSPVPQLQIGDVITVGNNDLTDYAFMPSGLLLMLMQQGQAPSYTPAGLLLTLLQPQLLPIYTDYTVVGITHNFTDDTPMSQVLELEEKVLITYFTIGSSIVGGPDSLAPG